MEKDSTNLFNIAQNAIEKKPELKVIIIKRLQRYDPVSADPQGIKHKLSKFANDVYDQLWFKRGGPKNIFVVDIDLQCTKDGYLKDLIYGKSSDRLYDGIHLRGEGGNRHFSYRAVNAIKPILNCRREIRAKNARPDDRHTDCPQARFKRQSELSIKQAGQPVPASQNSNSQQSLPNRRGTVTK